MHNWDWSDLRYVLAVARQGSAAAARVLGVNHSTVARRVRAFEDRLGVRVFDHLSTGYRLTEDGKAFLEAAESIDGVLHELGRSMVRSDDDLAGHVRITTTDSIAPLFVDTLAALRRAHPQVTLELLITNARLNLEALDADIALRPTLKPPEQLVGRKICDVGFGLYAAKELLAFRNHLWLLHHRDVRRCRRVRVVSQTLVTALRVKRGLIEGPGSGRNSRRPADAADATTS